MQSKYAPVEAIVYNVAGVSYTNATEAEAAGFRTAVEHIAFGGGDLLGYTLAERQAIAKFMQENRSGVTRVMNDDYSVVRLKPMPEKPPAPPAAVTNTPRAGETAAQAAYRQAHPRTFAAQPKAEAPAPSEQPVAVPVTSDLEQGLDDALQSLRTAAQ
jgi:hypothetical protein